MEEQKETLQKERQEHTSTTERLQKADQELKKLRHEIGGHYIECNQEWHVSHMYVHFKALNSFLKPRCLTNDIYILPLPPPPRCSGQAMRRSPVPQSHTP